MTTANANPAAPAGTSTGRAWLLRAGGALLLGALIGLLVWRGQLQPDKILEILGRANPTLVLLSLGIYFPFVLIKSERWRLLAADLGIAISPGEAWRLYAIGLGAGAFTPGQAGDLVKAWTLQRRGHRLGAAVASSVLDRICDLAGLAVLAALGVWVFGRTVVGDLGAIALLGAGAGGAVILFARRDLVLRLIRRRTAAGTAAESGIAGPASAAASNNAQSKIQNPKSKIIQHWAGVAGLTALSFVVSTLRVWLLGVAIGLPLDPATVGGLTGLTTVAALIPVSVSGVGTRDTAMVALLAQLGRPAAEAVAFSTLILVLNIGNALFGYLVWWVESRIESPLRRPAPR